MLKIYVPPKEMFDEATNRFITYNPKGQQLELEHSLISISKWESKWKKPFLDEKPKTYAELIDYVKCMSLNNNVLPEVFLCLTTDNIDAINAYLQDPMTATWFTEAENKKSRVKRGPVTTAELIYFWMIEYGIPMECQKWHINKLLTLLKVCEIKNAPAKKMSQREIYAQNKALNAARKKK